MTDLRKESLALDPAMITQCRWGDFWGAVF